jgi:DNA invertase Pin-like site-specific DNA recombinase
MKLGIYCRISREKVGNDLSINDQKEKGIKKAKELGLQYDLYIDEGISGTSSKIEDRPEFERLIADVSNGTLVGVFAFDQSRFERNPQVRYLINEIFKKNDIQYYTEIDGLVDLHDPQAEFFGDLVSVINKYQVTLTKIKVKSALRSRVASGKAHSILPYGYTKDGNQQLVIDNGEAEIIKEIYNLSLSGMGTRSIAAHLNEMGVQTRYNKINIGTISTKNKYTGKITVTEKKDVKWEGNTIRNIIINTLYKGERIYSGEKYKVPAIINSAKWEKVNQNLVNNRNNTGKKVEHKYLLKGLLRCGVCGRNMYGRTRVNKHDNHYMCSSKRIKGNSCDNRSINIDRIEAFIWDRFFKGEEFLNRIRNEFQNDKERTDELANQVNLLETKIIRLKNEKKRAIELVIKGTITEDDAKNVLQNTKSAIEESEILLKEKATLLYAVENNEQTIKKYEDEFIHFTTNTSFDQKRKIVNDFIKNIIVKYDDVCDSYEIVIEFKIDIPNETYQTFNRFTNIEHGGDFVLPRTLKKDVFRLPTILTIDGANVEMLGGDDSVPYQIVSSDGHMEKVYNTKVPYGNVDEWDEDDTNYFFENNPDWYCPESGVSLWSKNTEVESYNEAKQKHQIALAKKNDYTHTLDTISSLIV